MLEYLIAYHCAPALAGIKPACIVACRKRDISDIHKKTEQLNAQLNCKDIYFEIICECENRVLIMAYKKEILKAHLKSENNALFLSKFGYGSGKDAEYYISVLKKRLKGDMFPHEIGVFLGYPLHDILGFINHRDEGCLMIGEWKVYKNPEKAEKMFFKYKMCRKTIVKQISDGKTLAQIFRAA